MNKIMQSWFLDNRATNSQNLIQNFCDYLVNFVLGILPHAPIANQFKSWLMRLRGATVGKRTKLFQGIWVNRFSQIQIGNDVSIANGVFLISVGGLKIGDRTMIGYGSKIITSGHNIPKNRESMRFSGAFLAPVVLEKDVWVGAQAVILPGVTVGEGSIVAAGAVVSRDVEPFSIVGGVPATLIKMRD